MRKIQKNDKGQAIAPQAIPMTKDVFQNNDETNIYWLGSAGVMIHSHNTNLLIDPVLQDFDMPLLYDVPLQAKDVVNLDGLFITHIDNDHFSRSTCTSLKKGCQKYYAPNYVAEVMQEEGYDTKKMDIHESVYINDLKVALIPAKHNWQNGVKKWQYRYWEEKDYCGYWIETVDGEIWIPGDSKLLEEQLQMPQPDVILFDFSDNEWHITFEGAVKLANTYPNAKLICIHWGSVEAAEMTPFNGNPENLLNRIINPERILVLAPGEKYTLKK